MSVEKEHAHHGTIRITRIMLHTFLLTILIITIPLTFSAFGIELKHLKTFEGAECLI